MEEATYKQVKFMKNLGVSDKEAENMSKQDARVRIDSLIGVDKLIGSDKPKVMSESEFKGKSNGNGSRERLIIRQCCIKAAAVALANKDTTKENFNMTCDMMFEWVMK